VRDRSGNLYAGVGGLLAGWGGGALLGGATVGFVGWVPTWGVASAAGPTVVGTYMLVGALAGWWLPGRTSNLAIVIQDAQDLSAEIAMWLSDWKASDPLPRWSSSNDDEIARHHAWVRGTDQDLQRARSQMAAWNQRFALRALLSFDRLVKHGAQAVEDIDRFRFQHATNPLGMRDIGEALGVMAGELEKRKLI
jgi:hypothetical protein